MTVGQRIKSLRKSKDITQTELGIREITMHGLRHTYATRLFEKKAEIKTVQKLMGHSDIDTTLNIYTHVMGGVKEEAFNELNDFL